MSVVKHNKHSEISSKCTYQHDSMERNGNSGYISLRDRKGGSSRLIATKYFTICKGILIAFFLASLIVQPAYGEYSRSASDVVRNLIDRRSQANKSDIDIFYNNTNKTGKVLFEVNAENKSGSVGKCTTCLKEHRVKTREVPEDRRRKRKERSNERRKGRTSSAESSARIRRPIGLRDQIRSISLEAIKGNILSKLGMSEPPNLTGRPLPKIADHRLAALLSRRHNGPNGMSWVLQEDEFEEMQGDSPYSGEASDKVNSINSDFSNKNYTQKFHNLNDNNHNGTSHFQDAVGYMEEDDDYYVRTEKIFAFSEPQMSLYLGPRVRHSQYVQHFQFSDKIKNSKVKKAVLWIYIRGRGSVNVVGDNITIAIYRILHVGEPGLNGTRESPVITSILTGLNQNVPNGTGGWITLDYIQIRNLVAEWFRYPHHNLGIIITAEDANRNNLAVTSHNGNGTAFVPFLEIHVTDSNKHRKKRTIGLNCNRSSKETRCCRHPLTVNFDDFGWDWVIAPKTYEANSCSGDCPFAFLTKHPHTHVMQLVKAQGVGQCCSPRKVSGIFMIYFDQQLNIRQGMVPGMVVDSCGCD